MLAAAGPAVRCPDGHSFDLARQGYVDLTGGRVTHDGDTADMVAARDTVLRAGHFAFVTEALDACLPPSHQGLIVDVGAGTGHHLAAVLEGRPGAHGLALDVSR